MVWTKPDFGGIGQNDWKPAKLGPVDLFRAVTSTAYDAAASWAYLGRLKPGSYKNSFKRRFYDLVTGVPETPKESFVTGIEGSVEASLIEITSLAYATAVGNGVKKALYGTVTVSDPCLAASTTDTLKMTDGSKFAIGDEIEVGTTTLQYTFVIAKPATNDLEVYPKLASAPAAAVVVKLVKGWRFTMGGVNIDRHALRAVACFTDGSQLVTWCPDVRSNGVADDFKDNKTEMELPLDFTLFGVVDPDSDVTGPIVAKKYILSSGMAITYD